MTMKSKIYYFIPSDQILESFLFASREIILKQEKKLFAGWSRGRGASGDNKGTQKLVIQNGVKQDLGLENDKLWQNIENDEKNLLSMAGLINDVFHPNGTPALTKLTPPRVATNTCNNLLVSRLKDLSPFPHKLDAIFFINLHLSTKRCCLSRGWVTVIVEKNPFKSGTQNNIRIFGVEIYCRLSFLFSFCWGSNNARANIGLVYMRRKGWNYSCRKPCETTISLLAKIPTFLSHRNTTMLKMCFVTFWRLRTAGRNLKTYFKLLTRVQCGFSVNIPVY